nr:putative pentatricopeptide repeat-containing protein At1g69350, mitochondrial [Coffea arabica]
MTLYMRLFRACSTSTTLTQIHGHLIVTGLYMDPLASTKLIESYAQMGPFESSRLVFDHFQNPDSFMWGVIVKCHVWNGFFQESISLYHRMIYKSAQISSFIYPSVLRACSAIGDFAFGQKVHGRIIKSGFVSDFVTDTSLLNMYGEMGRLDSARKVFDYMSVRDVVSWSSIISSYVQNGRASEGLHIFGQMMMESSEIDEVTMLSAAEACGELGLWRLARSLHGFVLRRNIQIVGALGTSLVAMYGKCGDMCSSEGLFTQAAFKNTSLWTAMISCYHQNGCYHEALRTFVEMQGSNVEPNAVTLMSTVCSCSRLGRLKEGKSIHGFVIRTAVDTENDLMGPALIDLYANCGKLKECHKVFEVTQDRRVVSWNLLISNYAREGMTIEAIKLFKQMLVEGIQPDSFTLSSVISACGDIGFSLLGCQIHGSILKTGFSSEFVQNSLIDMYCKCGLLGSAHMTFDDAKQRGVVTWNTLITGLLQNGKSEEAMALFSEMYAYALEMDEVTFLSAIQACSNLGYIRKGKWIHHKMITSGMRKDMYIDTALIDMYAKCGELQIARKVFDSMLERSVVSWSTLLGAYGMHGQVDAAILVFKEMVESGIRPNTITFMNILSACSHAGNLEEGKKFFNSMRNDFGIEPNSEHYACLVDLLSRAGDLNGAYSVILSMPSPVDASIWAALVNGCRIHQRMDVINSIRESLLNIRTDDTGYYTLLSNLYAGGGEWGKFRMIRSTMKRKGLEKVQGCSMIEIDKKIHKFGANDKSHLQIKGCNLLANFLSSGLSKIVELDASVI